MQRLIGAKSNLNAKNKKGMIPLHMAAAGVHPSACQLLIEEGSNVYAKNNAGETPLECCKREQPFCYGFRPNDKRECVKLLQEAMEKQKC